MNGKVAWVLLVGLVAGCGGRLPDIVSDTGYQGTWQRGHERVQSTIAIVRIGEAYRFRWGITSADGKWRVRCTWEGVCEEFVDGEKTSDYTFRTWIDETSGRLRVQCDGQVHRPEPLEIHYVEELKVIKEGRTLRSHTLEDKQRTYEEKRRPRRDFQKISDYVLDPPAGWTPPGR